MLEMVDLLDYIGKDLFVIYVIYRFELVYIICICHIKLLYTFVRKVMLKYKFLFQNFKNLEK